jgi:proton-dependent oligopeptide transporter, POT family
LIQYIYGRKYLKPAMDRLDRQTRESRTNEKKGFNFTSAEWKRLAAVIAFFVFASIFWAAYEQAGSTLNLFADRYTRLTIFGMSFPSSWFQSVPAIFVITLAPVAAWLWMRLGPKEPSSPAKFTYGLFFMGIGFLVLVPAALFVEQTEGLRVSPMWLVGVYFFSVVGELCVSPVGLSLVTKLAPARIVGFMMGVWLLAISVGDIVAGWLTGFMQTVPLPKLFGVVAVAEIVASVVLLMMIKPLRKLMGGIH